MIDRYSTEEIKRIWSDYSKYSAWLAAELAILKVKVEMGMVSNEESERIFSQAEFDVERINELDEKLHHDLLAFVTSVRESLDPDLRKLFHEDITSYDTEEPATALLLINSMKEIQVEIDELAIALADKAMSYKYVMKIQRTHGQHAQPSTVGLEFLWWYDALARQRKFLELATEEIKYTKISGAVGTYEGRLSPELEKRALESLGLKPAPISMQIILRDRHAHLMNALAVLAAVLENMALNVELMGQTEICEYQEPFKKDQKGSSIMPHKKNTILSENLRGLARLARHYAGPSLENIPTWSARDISHSSVERVVFPDMFNLVHFMLRRTRKLIQGLVINEEIIIRNLNFTRGIIFSPDVNQFLTAKGFDPEVAYQIAQQSAFTAHSQNKDYLEILLERDDITGEMKVELESLFDLSSKVRHVNEVFALFEKNRDFLLAKR